MVCGGDGEGKGQKEAAKERRKEKEGAQTEGLLREKKRKTNEQNSDI